MLAAYVIRRNSHFGGTFTRNLKGRVSNELDEDDGVDDDDGILLNRTLVNCVVLLEHFERETLEVELKLV